MVIVETKKTPNRQPDLRKEETVPSSYINSKPMKTLTESVTRKLRLSPSVTDTQTHADLAIQRWKEKIINQSKGKLVFL